VRIDLWWAGGDINRIQAFARDLVGLQPDIILAGSTPPTAALQRETRTIPIVLVGAGDPVASGIAIREINNLRDDLAAVAAVVNGRLSEGR
jgi:putative ABC transport system substrate-binding protein